MIKDKKFDIIYEIVDSEIKSKLFSNKKFDDAELEFVGRFMNKKSCSKWLIKNYPEVLI